MPTTRNFQFGDRVIHTGRPEWGVGIVSGVQAATHQGEPCQRVTLRFDRAGLKTLLSAAADLRLADEEHPTAGNVTGAHEDDGWLDQIEARDLPERMGRLPESAKDPFASLEDRLRATLDLYRFSDQGASLLDWAAMQTRLADPMTRFNRHQLEEYFRRFAHNRDEHLRALLAEATRKQPDAVARVAREASPAARAAMQRAHAQR